MLFVGDDWAEDHHDVELVNDAGERLARRRLPEGAGGITAFHGLIAQHLGEDDDPSQVIIGIETDRGPWVQALIAAGYIVYAVNPLAASHYRGRHSTSGAKSDPGDAHVLAELVRLDRAHHRPVAGDSPIAEEVKVLARAHQSLVWARQRQTSALRSTLREFYPAASEAFGDDLAGRDALAVLAIAPTPDQGKALSAARIAAALRRSGRKRNITKRTEVIMVVLRSEQLGAHLGVVNAYGASVNAMVAIITEMSNQIAVLQKELDASFDKHPDREIYLSQPGLGPVLAARVLAEFGDDPDRYETARARKNYSGMSPITRASGTKRVVLARYARNRRLGDALYWQAMSALTCSPGARAYYDRHRAKGDTHHQGLRALANRLVGILHGCLKTGTIYNENTAWSATTGQPHTAAA